MFTFSDNAEIIPITSNFYYPGPNPENITTAACVWSFNLISGYKLKINIKQIDLTSDQSLILQSNGSLIPLNSVGVQYFEGSYFTISFNQSKASTHGFGGIVTAVKKSPIIAKGCTTNGSKFSNFNLTTGYLDDSVSVEFPNFWSAELRPFRHVRSRLALAQVKPCSYIITDIWKREWIPSQ